MTNEDRRGSQVVRSLELLVIRSEERRVGQQLHRAIPTFDNGGSGSDDHLVEEQRQRYSERNVHEAEEDDIFVDLIRPLISSPSTRAEVRGPSTPLRSAQDDKRRQARIAGRAVARTSCD